MSFIAANKVYTSATKTTIVSIETELFFSFLFLAGVDASHVYVRALALGCFHSHISTQTPSTGLRHLSFNWRKAPESGARSVISTQNFWRALTASVDSCAEITSAPSVA